jgi:DNA-binding response OmpR family regulator
MSIRKRVLLVEDHDDSREILAALLRRSGFDVFAYDRCKPAEPHLGVCDVEIALLDVRMPERCGDDFGRELRARCPKVMIVFVTGEPLIDPLKAAVPDCFVMRKPIDVAVLLELLKCFNSDAGYRSPVRKEMDDRVRPGNM